MEIDNRGVRIIQKNAYKEFNRRLAREKVVNKGALTAVIRNRDRNKIILP